MANAEQRANSAKED